MTFRLPDLNSLRSEPALRQFVGYLHATLLVAALIILLDILIRDPVSPIRLLLVCAYSTALALSYLQLKRDGPASSLTVLVLGLWAANAAGIATFGIGSANMLVLPFLITLAGWVMGRRWLLGMVGLSILLVLVVGLGQHMGVLVANPQGTRLAGTVITVAVLLMFGLLTIVTFETFTRSRDTAVTLSEALSQHYIGLAQREREIELIVNNIGAALAAFGLDSRLRMANEGYAALFGKRPQDLIGKTIHDFAPPAVVALFEPAWERCLRDGQFQSYRRKHIHPTTGVETIVDVELTPEFDHGTIEGLFVLIIDVTEKVRAEERIRELNETLEKRVEERTAELAETMEKLNRSTEELAKSEAKATIAALVASVSHELGTPIGNGVMTASAINNEARRFIEEMAAGQMKRSELNEFLDSLTLSTDLMLRNLARAEELVSNFKQVSADQASEQRRTFDLATAVQEVLQTMSPVIKRKPQPVVTDIPSDIQMDSLPGPLGQIIINLINNAYLHAFDGRSTGQISIMARAEGAFVTLTFSDDGVGIPPENLDKLFQPFFSTKIGKGGTGLGMSIVETLVAKSLGGSVSVASTVGVGTTFTVTLPLVLPEALPPPIRKRRSGD